MLITDSSGNPTRLVTPQEKPVRFSFVDVYTGKPHVNAAKENVTRYSTAVIIPKQYTDIYAELMQLAQHVAQTQGPGVWKMNVPQPAVSVQDGDAPKQNGTMHGPECAGCWVLNLNSQIKPEVVGEDGMATSTLKSGDWGQVSLTAYAYNMSGNKGISFGLGNIRKLMDGEPLSGGGAASDFGLTVNPQANVAAQQPSVAAQAPAAAVAAPTYAQPAAAAPTQYAASQPSMAQPQMQQAPGVPQQGFANPTMQDAPVVQQPPMAQPQMQQQAPLGYNPNDPTLPF